MGSHVTLFRKEHCGAAGHPSGIYPPLQLTRNRSPSLRRETPSPQYSSVECSYTTHETRTGSTSTSDLKVETVLFWTLRKFQTQGHAVGPEGMGTHLDSWASAEARISDALLFVLSPSPERRPVKRSSPDLLHPFQHYRNEWGRNEEQRRHLPSSPTTMTLASVRRQTSLSVHCEPADTAPRFAKKMHKLRLSM